MIVFDLDNTLRDSSIADHLAPKGIDATDTKNWKPWQVHVVNNGEPIESICNLYKSLVNSHNFIVIKTSSQFGTRTWLVNNDLPIPNVIDERDKDDHRTPRDMKVEWVTNQFHRITLWVDDDKEMCDYVERLGVPVVRVGNHHD